VHLEAENLMQLITQSNYLVSQTEQFQQKQLTSATTAATAVSTWKVHDYVPKLKTLSLGAAKTKYHFLRLTTTFTSR
jgi:hypothetical protein